jgi:hypothetical protein
VKAFAVIGEQHSERRFAEARRLIEHRVEHRSQVAGGAVDDLQHLGGRGLLLQRLARLGDQPRVLDRDHRLRCEVFEQRDFLIGIRPDLSSLCADIPEERTLPS